MEWSHLLALLDRHCSPSSRGPAVMAELPDAVAILSEDLTRASLDSTRSTTSLSSLPNGDTTTTASNGTAVPAISEDEASTSSPREAELSQQLAQIQAEKETLEGQYRGLLSKLTTMRSTLGDKLKQDAVRLALPFLDTRSEAHAPRSYRTSWIEGRSRLRRYKLPTTISPLLSRLCAQNWSIRTPMPKPLIKSSTCYALELSTPNDRRQTRHSREKSR